VYFLFKLHQNKFAGELHYYYRSTQHSQDPKAALRDGKGRGMGSGGGRSSSSSSSSGRDGRVKGGWKGAGGGEGRKKSGEMNLIVKFCIRY